jgi:dienelactone hydrolase
MKNSILPLFALILLLSGCGNQQNNQTQESQEPVMPKIVGEEVSYSADTLTMNGYLAYDENLEGKRPGILVVHEWWGHNEYARERAEMLAELGYVALAVDMYGDGKLAQHPTEAGEFVNQVFASSIGAKDRFESALELLKSNEMVSDKIGAVGYCFGGSIVLSMANAGLDLEAVGAFHAGLSLPIWPGENGVQAQILVCNGADDSFIQEPSITNYKNKMDSAGVNYKYISYPGAVHSFTSKYADGIKEQFPQMDVAYHPEADSASWAELQALFERAL